MNIVSRAAIQESARRAADKMEGVASNPYPIDSVAHVEWRQAYLARARAISAIPTRQKVYA